MKLKNNTSLIIFDYDGVVLDSNKIKTDAFQKTLFDEDPILVSQLLDYHRLNGGVSRYNKIKYFYHKLKKDKSADETINNKIELFGDIVEKKLLSAEFVPGIKDFLRACHERQIPCVVCSGGKEEEVRDVSSALSIDRFFEKIYGSPKTKSDILELINDEYRLDESVLYFGDARSDLLAAKKFNVKFVFVSGCSEWKDGYEFCKKNRIDMLKDFSLVKFEKIILTPSD